MLPAMGMKRLISHSPMPTTINAITIFIRGISCTPRRFRVQSMAHIPTMVHIPSTASVHFFPAVELTRCHSSGKDHDRSVIPERARSDYPSPRFRVCQSASESLPRQASLAAQQAEAQQCAAHQTQSRRLRDGAGVYGPLNRCAADLCAG